MTELTKDRIQQIWDYELINAWDENGYNKIHHVLIRFLVRAKPNLVNVNGKRVELLISWDDLSDVMVRLNLLRCLDINGRTGEVEFRSFKADVIGFIYARSRSISDALVDGTPKPVILLGINDYKWKSRDVGHNKTIAHRKRIERNRLRTTVTLRAREIDGRKWGTTKAKEKQKRIDIDE